MSNPWSEPDVNQAKPWVWSDSMWGEFSTAAGIISFPGIHTRILKDIAVGFAALMLFIFGIAFLTLPDLSAIAEKIVRVVKPI